MSILRRERGRFGTLLVAQIVFIFLTPFIAQKGIGRVYLYVGVFGILLAGLWASSRRRGERTVAIVILLPVLYAWLGPDFMSENADLAFTFLTPAVSYAFTGAVVIRQVFRHDRVDANTILGAINAYLLLSFAFMFLHIAVIVLTPEAYAIRGGALVEELFSTPSAQGFATMIYFSFTTFTTLGYGDIVPVSSFARLLTSAEAVVGQLYVAIIIGRLVGLEVGARSAERARSP